MEPLGSTEPGLKNTVLERRIEESRERKRVRKHGQGNMHYFIWNITDDVWVTFLIIEDLRKGFIRNKLRFWT